MQILLKNKILKLVGVLKEAKKLRLAECIEKNYNKTCLEYSRELNFWRPKRPIESTMLKAFEHELERLGTWRATRSEILSSIKKRRVLQTAPHLGVTENPRMLCINWLGSLGVSANDFYVVAMFSGIPFSNRSRPGRINRKNDSINLFPSSMQDGLVYRSLITKKLKDSMASLPGELVRVLSRAVPGESYTKWALEACQHIERKILKKNNLVFLDINEVVTEYLTQVLQDKTHIIYKLFFDVETRDEFSSIFSDEIMFYSPFMDGKYEKMENVTLKDGILQSKHKKISLDSPEDLLRELKDNRLCPALLISFLSLSFLNQFKCFGSFAQVEYLPVYQEKLSRIKALKEFHIEKIPTSNLTTGVLPEKMDLYPADIILSDKKFKPDSKTLFGEILLPMKKVLFESYFTGDQRKK